MVTLISNQPEDIKEELLPKKETLIDNPPLNIEQELLAEVQVYRDKQKRWEDSQTTRKYKKDLFSLISCLSFAWLVVMGVSTFLPSILPAIHPELSAINAGILLVGVLLGLYDIAKLKFEKRSIYKENVECYQTKVANDKNAQKLLNQLKQNQDINLQNVDEQLEKSFSTLSMLTTLITFFTSSAVPRYTPLGESYAAWLLYFVLLFLAIAAHFYCRRMAGPVQKPIEHESEGKGSQGSGG